ncbi:peptidase M16 [Thalassotalea litorea]|uniref:Protease 3 n=1 Tax=Thalassotalea litorea TaxID=2020715 RepID=A0A5R9IQ50_9GAMM|nr:insulinase family protein [Thalassotalea litorea]TLU67660.1 peptidase M16 [Thalassotalea litorea]
MKTSPNDHRLYHPITLENGLRAVVVENNESTRAAASIVVNAGHFDDPDDTQGLAHFLEHMLFLGTKSFPDSGEYQQFISQHNGTNNAWTGSEHTCFYFDIDSEFFEPALERFSRFFSEPLLAVAHIETERNNVDAEFQMKLKEDSRRIYDAQKETVNPNHPFSKFSVGNLTTLQDRPERSLQQALQQFFQSHYHAKAMTLAVESPYPLTTVQPWIESLFAPVRKPSHPKPVISEPLYRQEDLAIQLSIPPQQSQRKLIITFALPGLDDYYENKPVSYLSYLLGHEGPGSILSVLKKRQWAMALTSGGGVNGSNFKDFNISIALTEVGERYQTEIIELLFSYLRLLKKAGIQELYFNEKQALTEFAFNYKETSKPLDNVNQLAINMQHYPQQDYVYGDYKIESFNPDLLQQFLGYFVPENMRIMEVRKNVTTSKISRWYKTPYHLSDIDQQRLMRWQDVSIHEELRLPLANPFIVADPRLYRGETTDIPIKIYQRPGFNFWFKQDKTFSSPKGQIFVSLESGFTTQSDKHIAMTRLFVELFSESVQEQNYQAELAGIHYQIYAHQGGITLQISGISEKQPLLLDNLLTAICDHSLPLERFKLFKKQLINNWQDIRQGKPVAQLFAVLNGLFKPYSPHALQLATALTNVGFDDFADFCAKLFQQLSVEAFAYGNWPKSDALLIAKSIEKHLEATIKETALVQPDIIDFQDTVPAHIPVPIADNDNACVIYFPMPDKDFTSKAMAIIASQVLAPQFFHQLRTEKQLGYLLGVNYMPMNRYPGIACFVQSPQFSPQAIETEMMAFFENFAKKTQIEGWEKLQQGIINQLDAKDSGPRIRSQRFWHSISNHDYEFNNRLILKREIQQLTQTKVLEFVKTQLTRPSGIQPIILSTVLPGTEPTTPKDKSLVFTNIGTFHQQYPLKN